MHLDERTADMQDLDESGGEARTATLPQGQPEESFLDRLRREREEKAQSQAPTEVIDVPGYNGRVAIVFAYPEGGYKRAISAVRQELSGEPDARLNAALDLIIGTTVYVAGKTETGALVDLASDEHLVLDDLPDPGVRFTSQLAGLLGMKIPDEIQRKGRFICRSLFSPRGESKGEWDGDLALIGVANRILAWLNGAQLGADEEQVGE